MSKMSSIVLASRRAFPLTVVFRTSGTPAAGTVSVNDCGVRTAGETDALRAATGPPSAATWSVIGLSDRLSFVPPLGPKVAAMLLSGGGFGGCFGGNCSVGLGLGGGTGQHALEGDARYRHFSATEVGERKEDPRQIQRERLLSSRRIRRIEEVVCWVACDSFMIASMRLRCRWRTRSVQPTPVGRRSFPLSRSTSSARRD